MKKLFYFLLISFFSFITNAQNDSLTTTKTKIGVVSADKLNIVYRGVSNPISISVTNCKSFTATAPGLTKKSEGKYWLAPGSGLYSIIKLDIELNNGSKITEEYKFRIKGINQPIGTINGKSCDGRCILEMTKEELLDAEISIKIKDFLFSDINFETASFTVQFSNNKIFIVSDNKFNQEVFNQILKLKKGDIFQITSIFQKPFNSGGCTLLPRITPIKIMIVDKEKIVNYYESKEFIKDSLKRIRIEKKLLKSKN